MKTSDNRSTSGDSILSKQPKSKPPVAKISWLLLLIGLAALAAAIYIMQNDSDEPKVNTVTREGVITQIQQLNRLQTVAFNVDTIITSEREGSWMKLWQDEQKALFIAKGRVQAGIDLSALTPEMVQVVQPSEQLADNADSTTPVSIMPQITITIPPSEIFAVYLDDIEIYDWQTGVFGMMQVDPTILAQAQSMAKAEVLERACRGDVMTIALDNAQTQLQQLFSMTGATVTVNTQGAGACQMPANSVVNTTKTTATAS